ncbi:MAG: CRISPR-associated helicase Cas3' [Desertifilum sp.]|nr:CRISPR-associated helicase Cas3' [Desertifilum sp.]
MSKPKQQRPYIFGRVFFPGEVKPDLDEVRLQPLGDHVGNVRRLVKQWEKFPCNDSPKRVLKAADLHDMGKPQRFAIQVNTDTKGKFKNYIYSFRGHRFLAESEDTWAQALARGHHDFSVREITKDTYHLKKHSTYSPLLSQNPLAYAEELYILEMCDQIEAELACRVLGDDEQAESRTFMDYTLSKTDDQTYQLDPWPFKQQKLDLTFRYWSKHLLNEEKAKLKELCDRNSASKVGEELDRIVKTWWHAQENEPKAEKRQVTLMPLSQKYLEPQDGEAIYQKLAGFSPNPMQEKMFRAIAATEHPAILLKAPTGTGKTESILFPALARGYRLFLPLPARSLLEDQKERIENYLLKFSNPDIFPENKDREISMVVDTGSQIYRWVYKNGKDITATLNINLRRHLYKGDVILTTIDKFIYRYFAFGDKQKSFVFPHRIHQENCLFCFDEAHSYDKISFTNFQSLVNALYEAGRSLVLMTATMPPELAERFDYLETIDYTTELSQQPERRFEWKEDLACNREEPGDFRNPDSFQKHFADIVVNEWKSRNQSSRIIAVAESVRDATAIYQQIKTEFGCDTTSENRWLFLYHGRIADQVRPKLYKAVKQRDDNGQPYIVVTTSAIEVGCDLNAEILVAQICPPENLIQRAGRCNRRGTVSDAKVIVVGDRIPDFANSLDEAGWQKYQEMLRLLKQFNTQLISQCISRSQHTDDYRIIELFSMLHDYVYGADLTCQPAHEKGLVITRSWTPSATLFFDDGSHGDWQNNLAALPQITVPINRLIIKKVGKVAINEYASIDVYERYYDQETTHYSFRMLRGGFAYFKDIFIRVGKVNDNEIFEGKQCYEYEEELGFINLPGIFNKWKSSGFDQRLRYDVKNGKGATLTYIKS